MKLDLRWKLFGVAICALVLTAIFPATALGQRRLGRSHRGRVVIYNYQPRPYVVYQRRPYQSYHLYSSDYRQRYYGSRYYTNGYSQPYYTNRYYSYRDSQPHFANRNTYSWANPTYIYRTQPRHRGVRIRMRFR